MSWKEIIQNKWVKLGFWSVLYIAWVIWLGNFWWLLGLGIIFLQQHTGLIRLDPASYYVDTAPMELNVPVILLLNVATLLVSVFVLIAPSYLVSHINPAKSMHYE